jgi:hypothetical protein
MKTKLFFSIFIISILLSCQQEGIDLFCQEESNVEIKEILLLEDNYNALLAFNILNPDMQAVFWKERLKFIIGSKNYTFEQVNHIKLLLEKIDPALYYSKDEGPMNTFSEFADEWTRIGLNLFEKEELFFIAFQVGTKDYTVPIIDPGDGGGGYLPNCKCNKSSWAACYFGAHGDCVSANCESTNWGCGIIGTSPCDGECRFT